MENNITAHVKSFGHKFLSILLHFIFISLVILSSFLAPIDAFAQEKMCSEAALRDLKVAIINCEGTSECLTDTAQVAGSDNIATVFNFFLSKGYKDFQIAGMLGNMKAESGIAPQTLQGKPGVITPADQVPRNQAHKAWGIVQWDPAHKMIDAVKSEGKDPNDIMVQLDFLWRQLEGQTSSPEKRAGDHLKATTDLASATVSFETKYEMHKGDPQPKRIVDAEEILRNAGGSVSASPATTASEKSSSVYILGDSITVGAASTYNQDLSSKGVALTISGVVARSWISAGLPGSGANGTQGTGKQALMADQESIKKAGAVIVALGTNGGLAANPVDEIINSVKSINSSAQIYWINIASTKEPTKSLVPSFNSKLSQAQAEGKIKIIDWAKTVDSAGEGTSDPTGLLADGIHPNKSGYDALGKLVTDTVTTNLGMSNSANNCVTSDSNSTNPSGLVETVTAYAWPDYRGRGFTEKMPAYNAAVEKAKSERKYVGNNGIDCGGFVTLLMINSGFDPNYNYGGRGGPTPTQKKWLDENWQNLGVLSDSSKLLPGDVAMQAGHTWVYVGDIPGFNSKFASASNGNRSPMAGKEGVTANGKTTTWYRKK